MADLNTSRNYVARSKDEFTERGYVYTPKKAAMVLLDSWLSSLSGDPAFMDNDLMTEQLKEYGWRVTDKRHEDIKAAIAAIIAPLKDRVAKYIEKME